MKHDYVRDTFFNGFHPINLIHEAPANYATKNANIITLNDGPMHFSLFFQDNATPQMEGLEELYNNIFFYLAIIMFSIS
jgi:Cytochrome C oxidase subunit II, transmembrane domain